MADRMVTSNFLCEGGKKGVFLKIKKYKKIFKVKSAPHDRKWKWSG